MSSVFPLLRKSQEHSVPWYTQSSDEATSINHPFWETQTLSNRAERVVSVIVPHNSFFDLRFWPWWDRFLLPARPYESSPPHPGLFFFFFELCVENWPPCIFLNPYISWMFHAYSVQTLTGYRISSFTREDAQANFVCLWEEKLCFSQNRQAEWAGETRLC